MFYFRLRGVSSTVYPQFRVSQDHRWFLYTPLSKAIQIPHIFKKKSHLQDSRPNWKCCILMINLIHNSSSGYNVHKYTIFSTTWPLKPFWWKITILLRCFPQKSINLRASLNISKVSTKIILSLMWSLFLTQRMFTEISGGHIPYVQSFEESSAIEHFILLNVFFLKTSQITEIVPKHYLQTVWCHTLGKSCTSLYGLATDII